LSLLFQHYKAQQYGAESYQQAHWRSPKHMLKSVPVAYQSWLLYEGSLTQRLMKKSSGELRVEVLGQALMSVSLSERKALNLSCRQWALVREVILHGQRQAWVYARTIIPLPTLHGPLRRLRYLGNQPLGEQLFTEPSMRREPLEMTQFPCRQLPKDLAVSLLSEGYGSTWGRRSIFRLSDKPLLVSEIFLPGLFDETLTYLP